jgi:hypothetical protein
MNGGKKHSNENLKATNHNTDNGRSETTAERKYFNYLGCQISYARCSQEYKPRMAMAKATFNK